jgi:hypothetical protein
MPVVDEKHTPQHQILVNQSILQRIKEDLDEAKKDLKEMKEMIVYLKKYTENKEKIEKSRWFR